VAHSTRTVPLIIASIIAILLVGGAYVLSGPIPFIDRVTAQSSEELLKSYAAKDTDQDGLPDWQESLYGTDPTNPNSFRADLSDSEAVSQGLLTPKPPTVPEPLGNLSVEGVNPAEGSLTDALAKEFFEVYFLNRGAEPPSSEEVASFAEQFVRNFQEKNNDFTSYPLSSVRVAGSGPDALRAYAVAAEAIFDANDPRFPKNEMQYLDDAVVRNDTAALDKLARLGAAFSKTGEELLDVPVPTEAQVAHLAIANAMKHMGTSVTNMSKMETDPVRVMLGMETYANGAAEYRAGFTMMNVVFTTAGVAVTEGQPGYDFYDTTIRARNAK